MANTDKPMGIQPLELNVSFDCHYYRITNNYGTALFRGDPIVKVAGGTIELATAGTGNAILGSIVALFYGPAGTYRPESLIPVVSMGASPGTGYDYWALVADNPLTNFLAQEDGVTTPLAIDDLGMNVNVVLTHAGNATTGLSGAELDSDSKAVTATLQIKLVDLHHIWDVDAGAYNTIGAYAKWRCRINNHQNAPNVAGI